MVYVTPTEEEISEKYDEYLENTNEQATEEVVNTYRALSAALDNYVCALSEFELKCGYRYAKGAQ